MAKAEAAERLKHDAQAKADALEKAKRAEEFQERFKQQDDKIKAAVERALNEAKQPVKPTEPPRKLPADDKSQLDKAHEGAGAGDGPKPTSDR